ncbi:DNA-binding transcriptional LysR family regulator [Herbaspirillum sp. Sphag1AN]|uniref:LysR family transcriptional regulator n=1 Tax=unclassified Herbaspirillum TaxID=2624150 RepID=UPI001621B82B|nr:MULTISPECIES: LysR family transcriptional regulator [unclassified Herbaspirillum]MBB3213068.1 DNA-binding transcriptional LysR family regulator [Herbaspirillum sp. Sphag1AN]MBB3246265.1 DNA-binding transcriptional LysR family regulator [Herbaspirillum sp. Sphag64]
MNPNTLDWALWRSFLVILREGSLAGAARALELTHPTVRRHLDELETQLGTTLFVRSPSGLIATELALSLRDAAQSMESAAALLVRTASGDAGHIAGTVRISASEIVGAELLPPILCTLKEKNPGLSFELNLSNRIEDVLRNDADIAVRMIRPTQDGLLARKVGQIPIGLYAHQSWIVRYEEPITLTELITSGHLIGYDKNPAIMNALRESGQQVTVADFGFRSDSDLAQLAALRAGLGVGFCQRIIAARDPQLRPILPDLTYNLEVWLVTHPMLRSQRRVRVTLDGLASGLRFTTQT